jgi:chromosome segregation ATPase
VGWQPEACSETIRAGCPKRVYYQQGEIEVATIDELENRTRFIESEVEGEKVVTRHVLQQASLNADDLGRLNTEVRHLNEQMVLANAALNNQGTRFTAITQDVTLLRQDVTALRRGMEEVHTRLDAVEKRLDAVEQRLDAIERNIATMQNSIAAMERRLDSVERNVATMQGSMAAMERRLDTMERNIAAILAAVLPGAPPPA